MLQMTNANQPPPARDEVLKGIEPSRKLSTTVQSGQGLMKTEEEISLKRRLVASSFGALFTSVAVTPIDVVKIRLQVNQARNLASPVPLPPAERFICTECETICAKVFAESEYYVVNNGLMDHWFMKNRGPMACAHPNPPVLFGGMRDAFYRILRYEGVGALYSGLAPTLWMSVPATVLYFTSYDLLRQRLDKRLAAYGRLSLLAPVASGCSARVLAQTVVSPLELIRTQMQARTLGSGIISALRQNIRTHGVISLWRGLLPTLWRDVPFSGIYWTTYEHFRIGPNVEMAPRDRFMYSFLSGAAAGTLAATLVTPMDVVKTRVQAVVEKPKSDHASKAKINSFTMARRIWAKEGFGALFTGLGARLIRVPPACAIMISSYEVLKVIDWA